jgi:hypothetical protein
MKINLGDELCCINKAQIFPTPAKPVVKKSLEFCIDLKEHLLKKDRDKTQTRLLGL